MSIQWETVAIPFKQGIAPSTKERLLPASKLLRAENCYYRLNGGPEKRNGHIVKQVITKDSPVALNVAHPGDRPPSSRANYSTANPGLPSTWVYGWGILDQPIPAADTRDSWAVSEHREAGLLFGQAARDNEILPWDGHRLFSYAPQQPLLWGESYAPTPRGPACMPMLRVAPIAKVATSQLVSDAADNGVLRVVAWVSSVAATANYSVYDSVSSASLVVNNAISITQPMSTRVISVGPWFHILVSDEAAQLQVFSLHQDTPSVITTRSLGSMDTHLFDVKKFSESTWFVTCPFGGVTPIKQMNADGSIYSTFTPNLSGHPATNVALEINANNVIGLLWSNAPTYTTYFSTYSFGGTLLTGAQTVEAGGSIAPGYRMTLAPRFVQKLNGSTPTDVWDIYLEGSVGGGTHIVDVLEVVAGVSITLKYTKSNMVLASHAFRVGNRTFVWCGTTSTLQTCWFLCDSHLLPVGRFDYGIANTYLGTDLVLPGVNWHVDDINHPAKDRIVFHGSLGYKQRVTTSQQSTSPNGVFAEPSIKFYELDFLPRLQYAQAGRSTYFAGAQLWAYDGVELNEAVMPMAPELSATPTQTTGGVLTLTGTYRYRIDLCHKNAQNEEVRSWSLITPPVTLTGSNNKITLSINTIPFTRREDSYFLVFRNENVGTNYYLVSQRDPSTTKFVKNNQGATTVSFVDDTINDATLISREYHPANAGGNYLDPLPAPACELVASGRDRLWLAGGELAQGEIAPSRYFQPGTTPAFSPGLNIQVDRNVEPVTAIGFVGEISVIFRRSATYVLESDGPDNNLVGGWSSPRLAVADIGAVSSSSLVLAAPGLFFQSKNGINVISASGQIDDKIGEDIQFLAIGMDISAAVVNSFPTQIRWYSRNSASPALVLDYSTGNWSTWTGLECQGANVWFPTSVALLTKANGQLWIETVGKWQDGDRNYEMVVKTAWLHAGDLGDFQRFRRFALFGQGLGAHTQRVRVFYNEEPYYSEQITIAFPGVSTSTTMSEFNTSIWGGTGGGSGGGSTWGGGSWGDGSNIAGGSELFFRNGVFRYRRRVHQQKCSVFSLEFSDQGANSAGFSPVVLALELGKRPGLDRIPDAISYPS